MSTPTGGHPGRRANRQVESRSGGRVDGRVERGNQTRRLVLDRTMDIASVEGLEGLSLGRIATDLKLSKSGVFALFGSKKELQLATIRAAVEVFGERVVQPTRTLPPGAARVWALCRKNAQSVLHGDGVAYERAGRGILRRLRAEATDPGALPDFPGLSRTGPGPVPLSERG
ncbi:TetR/AcrR family transcriptional regulator [Streptomyces sp. NPDC059396]|uniref:TetR/AcrR family transcriptional regulator n=1 Tax=Streptomyces sp. NPDC059396 TaxID=3346819 RepID=UPI003699DC3E